MYLSNVTVRNYIVFDTRKTIIKHHSDYFVENIRNIINATNPGLLDFEPLLCCNRKRPKTPLPFSIKNFHRTIILVLQSYYFLTLLFLQHSRYGSNS